MGVMKRGSGRGYPRDPEYGFTDDTADHKREQMAESTKSYNDMLTLDGPADVGWIVDPDFSISASRLTTQHARSAFRHYYDRRKTGHNASYARRLGSRLRAESQAEFRDEFIEVCKLTRRTCVAGLDARSPRTQGVIQAHQESLKYLGMLAIQAMRVIENGISLRGIVGDIRKTDVWTLCEVLDKMQIPACNQPNPYDFDVLPGLDSTLLSKWLRQDDPQIENINQQIQDGSIVGRNH